MCTYACVYVYVYNYAYSYIYTYIKVKVQVCELTIGCYSVWYKHQFKDSHGCSVVMCSV